MSEPTIRERLARMEERLDGIIVRLDKLPCSDHAKGIDSLKKKSYAASKVLAAMVAIGGLLVAGIEFVLRVRQPNQP